MGWPLEQIDTPALIIDLDVAEANLRRMRAAAQARGLCLWPHTKTHKSTWLAHQQVAHGADGLTVAKLGEAEVLRAAGLRHILIAYPLVGRMKAQRLARLLAQGTTIRVAIDSAEAADTVSWAANEAQRDVGILLEIDTGFHRVGVPPGDAAIPLAQYISTQPGLRLLGLACFSGHIGNATEEDSRQRILQRR